MARLYLKTKANEMETAKFEYRCRRCGEIEINPCTSPDNARMLLMYILYGCKVGSHFISEPPQEKEMHHCKDGGCGITDLLGYRVETE